MITEFELDALPGGNLIAAGLEALAQGRTTVESLLIEIAQTRLRRAGLEVPVIPHAEEDAELRLFDLLQTEQAAGAYSRYNALLRQLVSFSRALGRERQADP